jgi:hypothetical protein
MEGVAYTFGSHSEKEIHFSLDHIVNSAFRARDEINGVLVHEVASMPYIFIQLILTPDRRSSIATSTMPTAPHRAGSSRASPVH